MFCQILPVSKADNRLHCMPVSLRRAPIDIRTFQQRGYAPSTTLRLSTCELTRPMANIQLRISAHNLDDESLLNVFYFCRSSAIGKDENGNVLWEHWSRERWWNKLIHVCKRWRSLILGSPLRLDISLVCTRGTPVADMLAHSPLFPLVIDYDYNNHDYTIGDEEGIMLALQHRDRLRSICLSMPTSSLQKLIATMGDKFPMLQYLRIEPLTRRNIHLILPMAFEAPHLRHLILNHFASPIGSALLTSAVGLVTLTLWWTHPSTYPPINHVLQTLSLLHRLETLEIGFRSPVPKRVIQRQLSHMPIVTHVTLPNLHWFAFRGISAYLEALLPQMTTPALKTLNVYFFNELRFSVPCFLQFMMTTGNLTFSGVRFLFHRDAVAVFAYPSPEDRLVNFYVEVACRHLDWQLSSVSQIFNTLGSLFYTVIDLTLDYREHTFSPEWHNQADRTQWRELLGSFRNVKTLRVHQGLVDDLSHSLRLDGEPTLQVLPELQELVCPPACIYDQAFAPFILERRVAGRPIFLIGKDFPAGHGTYTFHSSIGVSYIGPD